MNKKQRLISGQSLSFRELLTLIMKKVSHKFETSKRFHWTYDLVFDAASIPELTHRTYLEIRDLQDYLKFISERSPIKHIADIATGFGRLLPLLSDFSQEVIGFEREKSLLDTARELNPATRIIEINDLGKIEFESSYFDLILFFTVLQHLTDKKVTEVYSEIHRLLKEGGYLLICEQTDSTDLFGDINNEDEILQHGRSVAEYSQIFKGLKLIKTSPRINEPTYRRKFVGSYMLFQKL